MGSSDVDAGSIDRLLAQRLKALRLERGWALDELARRSGVSRATLSRLENAEVSVTASTLGRLCTAYGLPMSRLMRMVEEEYVPLIRRDAQIVWTDVTAGFLRRSVSPPARTLAGEAIECTLEPGAHIVYDAPPRLGLEHHLLLLEGRLDISVDGHTYQMLPGDCLRYQLFGPSAFATPESCAARYILFIV